jgi:hypothetical protein
VNPRSNIYLWLVATAAMAALTSWIFTHRTPGDGQPSVLQNESASLSPPQPTLHEWMHRQLDLSPSQHAQLAPLETSFEEERLRLRKDIGTLNAELAVAMRDAAPDDAVLEIQRRLNDAQGALQEATLKHFMAMRRQLTERQAREFALWTHDSLLLPPSAD